MSHEDRSIQNGLDPLGLQPEDSSGEKPTSSFVDVSDALRGVRDEEPSRETNKDHAAVRSMGEEALRYYQGYMERGFPRDEAVDRALADEEVARTTRASIDSLTTNTPVQAAREPTSDDQFGSIRDELDGPK